VHPHKSLSGISLAGQRLPADYLASPHRCSPFLEPPALPLAPANIFYSGPRHVRQSRQQQGLAYVGRCRSAKAIFPNYYIGSLDSPWNQKMLKTAVAILCHTEGTGKPHCQYACAAAREGALVYPRHDYLAQDYVRIIPSLTSKLLFLLVLPRSEFLC